jgi:site-specific recombinase XerD
MAYFTSPHVAQRTLATPLLEITGDARLVQQVLGHPSIRAPRIYTQISDRRKREAYARGGRFSELLPGEVQ